MSFGRSSAIEQFEGILLNSPCSAPCRPSWIALLFLSYADVDVTPICVCSVLLKIWTLMVMFLAVSSSWMISNLTFDY